MAWEAWFCIGVVVLVFVALVRNLAAPDIVFLGAMALIVAAAGITGSDKLPTAAQAVAGFGQEGLLTIAVLFVVVSGMTQTGALAMLVTPMLGRPKSAVGAQLRLMFPVALLSAFLNNTPIVAMFLPVVSDWARRTGISASKLFIPLSFATILGGTCTLIGTSTNLVVNDLIATQGHLPALGLFEVGKIGLPCAVVGLIYLLLLGRKLLPDRMPALSTDGDTRRYTTQMIVEPASPLVGQTIEKAGLRHLPGLYLAEIERGEETLAAVAPTVQLRANDRLVFVGVVESVVDLQKIRGLVPATNQVRKLNAPRESRCLIEAVVSDTCPLVEKTIREGRFRSVYNAAVIAVARNGQRIEKKIGDIILHPGDTLLLEAHPTIADRLRNSRDFFLVSKIEGSTPLRHNKAYLALAILVGMVVLAGTGVLSMLAAALLAAVAMIATRCCTGAEARRSVSYTVLVVIGSAYALGKALDTSGAADAIARSLVGLSGSNPWVALLLVYLTTMLFTELMTNTAAAILVFPIAVSTAHTITLDGRPVSLMPFAMCIMLAASAAFATPIGYQTNLMVYGPGGYRFTDFTRIGLPLNLLLMAVAVTLAPVIWPF
ncbi:MAG: SLC13 family permease [Phycisphaera sp.]|nr:SLC13 family permease [Phycisphaera sp.]